jgi:hypothetical protein
MMLLIARPEVKRMAQPQLIQGSWEELSARADEFKDRKDLILIVPGEARANPGVTEDGMSLAEALKGRTGLVSFEPADLSEETGKKFAALLLEKQGREPQ